MIVIVVIAILAAITVVTYSNMQTRAQNSARVQEAQQWVTLIELHRADHGHPPLIPAAGTDEYCLGEGFPEKDGTEVCRDMWREFGAEQVIMPNSELNAILAEFGSNPSGTRIPVRDGNSGNEFVGPTYLVRASGRFTVAYFLQNSDCIAGVETWRSSDGSVTRCGITID